MEKIKESVIIERLKVHLQNIEHEEFLKLYNAWFSTKHKQENIDWDIDKL